MAGYGHQGGRREGAYGNPIPESYNATYNATGAGTGAHGTTGVGPYGTAHPQGGVAAAAAGGGGHGQLMPGRERSHSDDEGMGGRRKKGIKEKIKEKMPGSHKTDDEHRYNGQTAPMTTATAPPTAAEGGQARMGMMEKIKEKLPGGAH